MSQGPRGVAVALAVALAAVCAPVAHAAFSTPSIVSEVQLTTGPAVDVTNTGDAITVFNREQTYEARWRTAAGTLRQLRTIVTSTSLQGRAVAALPDGDAVVVWKDAGELYGRVALGTGGLGSVRKISTGGEVLGQPAVGADAGGKATIAWVETNAQGKRVMVRNFSRAGSVFGGQSLAQYGGQNLIGPALAVAENGAVVVSWAIQGNGVRSRQKQPGQTWPQSNFISSLASGTVAGLHAAINDDGDASVAWTRVVGPGNLRRIEHSTLPAGLLPPDTPVVSTVAEFTSGQQPTLSEGMTPDGRVLTLFDRPVGPSQHDIVLRVQSAAGTLGSAATVGENDDSPDTIKVEVGIDERDGDAVLAWRQDLQSNCNLGCRAVELRTWSAAGALGSPQRFGQSMISDDWDTAVAPGGPATVSFHDVDDRDTGTVRTAVDLDPVP